MYQAVHLPMERIYSSINGMDRRRNAGVFIDAGNGSYYIPI